MIDFFCVLNKLKSGLGYYNRARNLHKCAQLIVNEYNGRFPNELEILINRLPGVGRYTAGAVSSIAFNQVTCSFEILIYFS